MEQLNTKYRASIYLRLSKEDGDKVESNSIKNQRDLIYHFLADKTDIEVVSERIDDGYSGANFDRPAVQKMIEDTQNGVINCIIVKDLSRFGRNFVEVGKYIDRMFPSLGVRVISINENFDSANGRTSNDNILLPFLNLVNDAFCRDISIKVRSQLEIKRKKGDFIGSFAVYGYLKDPTDRHKLVVDDYAADVIRDIFKWKIEGKSQQGIADRLNDLTVLSPMEYKKFCGMDYRSGFQLNPKALWSAVAVGRILKNEFYVGTLVQGKRTTPNHKVKKTIVKPSDEWVRIKNNHEPIVTNEDFNIVGGLLAVDTRIAPQQKAVYTFSGLLYCADCGEQLVRSSVCKGGKTYFYYMCGKNRREKKCTSHRIADTALSNGVLIALKHHVSSIVEMERLLEYIDTLPYKTAGAKKFDKQILIKEAEVKRYEHLKTALFENMSDGIIDKNEYLRLKAVYEGKQKEAGNAILSLQSEIEKLIQNRTAETLWIQRFKTYQNIDSIDRKIAVNLIDKITVFDDKRIEIAFKYQYNYNLALSLIQNVGNHLNAPVTYVKEAV
ncbi:MAG: recombinase family protein [Rikenellaceae bacterium]